MNKKRVANNRILLACLISITVVFLIAGNIPATTAASFTDVETATVNSFQAWSASLWTQTSQADFNAGLLNNVDTATSPDNVQLILSGGGGTTTNNPSSSAGGWTNPTNAYADDSIYASITSGTPSDSETYGGYGFNLTGDTITQVRVRYDAWSNGAAITNKQYEYYDTGDDGNNTFYSGFKLCQTFSSSAGFSITSVKLLLYREANYPSTVTCEIFATTGSTPYPTGSALTSCTITGSTLPTSAGWVEFVFSSPYNLSASTTYAIVMRGVGGSSYPVHWRCDTSSPTYSNGMYGRSSSSGAWGTSYMDGTKDNLFQTFGNGIEYNDQIRVDVSWDGGTNWSSTQNTVLTSTETTTWYNVTSATSWTPAKLADGQLKVRVLAYTQGTAEEVRLDWLPVEVTYTGGGYASPGTVASQVWDTGVTGAVWNGLFWDETLASNTDITFEVRASDTSFNADDEALLWNDVGGTSPVVSGLPVGRYIQWRATLTTTDVFLTPTLSEVRVYYF